MFQSHFKRTTNISDIAKECQSNLLCTQFCTGVYCIKLAMHYQPQLPMNNISAPPYNSAITFLFPSKQIVTRNSFFFQYRSHPVFLFMLRTNSTSECIAHLRCCTVKKTARQKPKGHKPNETTQHHLETF